MGKIPCEYMIWQVFPVIRKELAKTMINHFGLSQKETAMKMGLTPAAVCHYLKNKRGKINIVDEDILVEIGKSAVEIIKYGESVAHIETCRLCKILREKGILSFSVIKD